MKDIKEKLIKLSEEVADYLGIDLIPIEYENLEIDDSRLILKPIPKIVLNIKYENNFIESAKCITHEMRHIFQIYYVNLMNDKLARIWKEELAQAKSSANIDVNSAMEICKELQSYLDNDVSSTIIVDREQAIRQAILDSKRRDVILISGRGNRRLLCNSETTFKLVKDGDVVEKVIKELGW